ncbi:hypothetical protein [Pseudocolwellia agarivorans]|uniref:hypothetical protein n=1 Tax=Pseudocolwellia agarivorans TaxID=1911682 RepID=UPI000987B01B|nr:hypothetical protein [Pseudocolwellia agarivorans]
MMPKNKLWGDQTKLSLQFFKIGHHQFSTEFINKFFSIQDPIGIGIIAGLVLGKFIDISGGCWLALKSC